MSTEIRSFKATPELEAELARTGSVSLSGDRYKASVACSGLGHYEAWTDTLPFVYGRPAPTLQGALDNLEAAVCAGADGATKGC